MRLATADDAPALADVEVAAGARFREVGMDAVADDEPPELDVYLDAVREGRLWVAEVDGELAGYVLAIELDGGWPHLEQVSVRPEHGGRGVGAALVDEVVRWADGRGPWLTLSTFRDLPWNRPWYERLGFAVVPEAELDARLAGVRAHEAELGLDVDARVLMRRPLG